MITSIATRTIDVSKPGTVPDEIYSSAEPLILRGLVKEWRLTQIGLSSDAQAVEYLKSHYNGASTLICFGDPSIKGRLFYDHDVKKLNYETRRGRIDEALDFILNSSGDEEPPACYVASNRIDTHFGAEFRESNDVIFPHLAVDPQKPPIASIWIGNRITASCHYDAPDNIACCAVGRRRFTLFPPDQIYNLYPGPLEPTPGGQAISMVDFNNPDYEKYPCFKDAMAVAQCAELEAGDALFIPSMWWHHVEALSPFNLLINYWWNVSPGYMGSPMDALKHAMLNLRDRPENEKQAWRHIFEYYVFGPAKRASEHLPEHALGELGPMNDITSRKLRAYLLSRLNR